MASSSASVSTQAPVTWIKFDRPVPFAYDHVGKTRRTAVQCTGSVDHLAIPAGGLSRAGHSGKNARLALRSVAVLQRSLY
jgi:hypothetical protein